MNGKWAMCGLGNPGDRYDATRHNLGFHVADEIAARHGGRWSFSADTYALNRASVAGRELLIVKPDTYMNLSGDAIAELFEREGVKASNLLVACDDIALPLGQIRLRARGSDGGHNGLGSIIDTLGHASFARLRLGVGPVPEGVDAADFVLAPVSGDEAAAMKKMARHAAKAVEAWLELGISKAMSRFNVRMRPPEGDSRSPESD